MVDIAEIIFALCARQRREIQPYNQLIHAQVAHQLFRSKCRHAYKRGETSAGELSPALHGLAEPLLPEKRESLSGTATVTPIGRKTEVANYFAGVAVGRPCSRSLLIFSTTPALRSATSLTLYSADEPITSATSVGVSAYLSVSQFAIFVVASRNASSIDPSSPTAMRCVADSTRGPGTPLPEITSTVNSTSIDVSSAFPFNSPSPCAAWPSPRYSIAPHPGATNDKHPAPPSSI